MKFINSLNMLNLFKHLFANVVRVVYDGVKPRTPRMFRNFTNVSSVLFAVSIYNFIFTVLTLGLFWIWNIRIPKVYLCNSIELSVEQSTVCYRTFWNSAGECRVNWRIQCRTKLMICFYWYLLFVWLFVIEFVSMILSNFSSSMSNVSYFESCHARCSIIMFVCLDRFARSPWITIDYHKRPSPEDQCCDNRLA